MAQIATAEWVARLRAGEPAAQGEFFSTHWGEVYSRCARVLGHGADASDVAVDVLVDFMFNYVNTLSRPDSMHGYLRLMSLRRSVRRNEARQRTEESDADLFADDRAATPEEVAELRALMPRLGDCLAELTPRSQQVLRLRFGGEMVNEKIGEIVGCTKMHVGRIIKQSLASLRACLERGAAAVE